MGNTVSAFKCEACDAIFKEEEANESPLYECQGCGTIFNRDGSADGSSHRCPNCNKFASKAGDKSCPQCDSGPLEAVDAHEDEDGDLVEGKAEAEDGEVAVEFEEELPEESQMEEDEPEVQTDLPTAADLDPESASLTHRLIAGHRLAEASQPRILRDLPKDRLKHVISGEPIQYMDDLMEELAPSLRPQWFQPQDWFHRQPMERLEFIGTVQVPYGPIYCINIFKGLQSSKAALVLRHNPWPLGYEHSPIEAQDQIIFKDSVAEAERWAQGLAMEQATKISKSAKEA